MVFKEIKLEGFGKILVQPISLRDQKLETVDPSGNPVTSERVGSYKDVYKNTEGAEIPRSQICKKVSLDGEDLVLGRFSQSKEISKDDIEKIEDPSLIYTALDRKFYAVSTEDEGLKKLITEKGVSLKFPMIFGSGWKLWNAILTNWHGHLLLVGCRGDLSKEMDKYTEETVEITIEVIPQQENMKKLVKAMAIA